MRWLTGSRTSASPLRAALATKPSAKAGKWRVATAQEKKAVLDALPNSEAVPNLDTVKIAGAQQTHTLRKMYAKWLLRFLAVQMVAANVAFFLYGSLGVGWDIPPAVMGAWLSATVVEVVGLVYAITKSLFPSSGTTDF